MYSFFYRSIFIVLFSVSIHSSAFANLPIVTPQNNVYYKEHPRNIDFKVETAGKIIDDTFGERAKSGGTVYDCMTEALERCLAYTGD